MTDLLTGLSAARSLPAARPTDSVAPTSAVDFRAALHAAAESLGRGEAALDGTIARLERGATLAPEELIALQAAAYRHATEVELAAKLVDKLTGAVRTTLTSQQ